MGDFSGGFGISFEIGSIIKEKKRAKKATEEMKAVLEEWRLSGKEPSYADKLMMGLTATQVGQTYSKIFGDITNNKAAHDKEKMSQNAKSLREYTNQIMNLNKQIQTAAKENTLDLFPWETFKEVFPDFDVEQVLSNIPAIQKQRLEAQARKENIDIYGKTPTDVRQGVGEQLGVIPEGVEPKPESLSVADKKYDFAVNAYKEGKINTDQLLKYFGMYIAPEKKNALQQKIESAKQYGASNEEIKSMLLGGSGGGGGEEEIGRTDIAYWEKTFGNIKNEEEYDRQYNLLKQSKTSKQYEPKAYKGMLRDEVKAMAKEIKGLLTSDNKFKSEEDKATYAKYQQIYNQKVMELISKYPDINKNQFPKYLPADQIKPIGFWKGAFTGGGVKKGDYSVIDTKGW